MTRKTAVVLVLAAISVMALVGARPSLGGIQAQVAELMSRLLLLGPEPGEAPVLLPVPLVPESNSVTLEGFNLAEDPLAVTGGASVSLPRLPGCKK